MSGGLSQLVAYGAQDVYLTGDPEITFFKVVYRRYTNFAIETIALAFTGNPDFGKQCNVLITRNGDLVTRMYLKIQLGALMMSKNVATLSAEERGRYLFAFVRELGNYIIDDIRFEIGGTQIDKHWGHWMSTWHDLTKDVNNNPAYRALVGDVDELTALRSPNEAGYLSNPYLLFTPLIFWCNTNTGLALPLIALQYHEVRLWFQFNKFSDLIIHSNNLTLGNLNNGNGVFSNAELLTDYVYIDTEERRRFAQIGHEYLINQLQYTGVQSVNSNPLKVTLTFNHPSKEFIWRINSAAYVTGNSPFLCYSNTDDWTLALQYAANNVIEGSVAVGTGDDALANPVIVNISSMEYDNWNTTNVVTTNTRNTKKYSLFSYVAGAGIDDANTPQFYADLMNGGTGEGDGAFLFRRDVLLNPTNKSYNLGDYIQKFQIVIFYALMNSDGTGVDGTLTYTVRAIQQSITVRDVSVPLAQWEDNRFTKDDSGYAPADIWAYLYTVTGLLINNSYNPVQTAVIQLNGQDRFQPREGAYFNLIETYNYHHSTPSAGTNVFSFALYPEQHQPSGTCNLSRIDTTLLNMKLYTDIPNLDTTRTPPPLTIVDPNSRCFVYDTNYNVLRIMSGMGGLAYSN